ncbi:hypothetical protein PoB_004072700 [Plakobranchus ocellatus]|uniref:Uncharacterized protein n=1 Tax=Plakobranchus ocellatus TaxID=259542 RepID=A0AAV4B539_9GAST|nr:hypothetical protein PoB_004072700 [Plakobranchus ocellatus]
MSSVHPAPPPPPPPGFQSPVSSLSSMTSMSNMGLPSMANFHQGMSNLHGMSGFHHPSYSHGHSAHHPGHQSYGQGMEYNHLAGGQLGASSLSSVPSGTPSIPYPAQASSTPALTPPTYDRRADGMSKDIGSNMRVTPGRELGENLPPSSYSASSTSLSTSSSSSVVAASSSILPSSGLSSSPKAGLLPSTSDMSSSGHDSASASLSNMTGKYPGGENQISSSPYATREAPSSMMDVSTYNLRNENMSNSYTSPTKDPSSSSSSLSHHHHNNMRGEEMFGVYSKENFQPMRDEDDANDRTDTKSSYGVRNGAGEGATEGSLLYSNKDVSSTSSFAMRSAVDASDMHINNYHQHISKHSFLTTYKDSSCGNVPAYTRNDNNTPSTNDILREGSVPMYNHHHMQQQQNHGDHDVYGPDFTNSSIANGSGQYHWGNIGGGSRVGSTQTLRSGGNGYSNTSSGAVVKQQPTSPAGSTGSLQSMSPPSSSDQSPYAGGGAASGGRPGITAGLAGESVDLSVASKQCFP